MTPAMVISVFAAVAHSVAYIDYNRKVFSGRTGPNGATWAIWSAIAIVSASTYLSASGDIWKSILAFSNIFFCIGTFILALGRGKFQRLCPTDWAALVLSGIALAVWKLSTAAYANVIVQIAIAIGFAPTWRAVRQDPLREDPRPWWLWASAYCLAVSVVFLRWRDQWIDLFFPACGVLLHASVPLLAFFQRKRLADSSRENREAGVSLET